MVSMKALLAREEIDVNKSANSACWGPIFWALFYSRNEFAKPLIDRNDTDINAVDKFGKSMLQTAVQHKNEEAIK